MPVSVSPHTVLALLTSSYLVGEMGHFMLGATSRDMSRDIGFGDKECVPRQNVTESVTEVTQCMTLSREECEDTNLCQWDYTGRGLDYQVLAGPAFIGVFSVSGVLFGLAADHWDRLRLLGGAVITFSAGIVMTSVSSSFWHLVMARMLVAAGESACSPLSVSLISDLYTDQHRGLATGILHLGVYLGFGMSQVAGIYLTRLNVLGQSWRAAYMVTGMPGLVLGLTMLMIQDRRQQRDALNIEREKSEVRENCEHLLNSPTKLIKSQLDHSRIKGLNILFRSLASPFMLLMFLAAACRHSAGFTWAYNCRLYFLSYFPLSDVGTYFSVSAILGGASGVVAGGQLTDWLTRGQHGGGSQFSKTRTKLMVLGIAMILSSPFAFGVLAFDPPWAFASLFFYYLLGKVTSEEIKFIKTLIAETWFGILFTTIVDVSPNKYKTTILGIFLFLMNNIGGNIPVLVNPISKQIGYRGSLYVMYPAMMFSSGVLFIMSVIPLRSQLEKCTIS